MIKYDSIIILGGFQSLTNRHTIEYPYKYLNELIEFTKIWIQNNIYILGICLGAQIIGEALGCKTLPMGYTISGYQKNIKLNIFDDNIIKNNIPIMMDYFISNHNDYVDIRNKNIDIIASLEIKNNMNVPYIFRYKNVYGLQFHPEITLNILKKSSVAFNMDIINFANNNVDIIQYATYTLFKNWLDIINK